MGSGIIRVMGFLLDKIQLAIRPPFLDLESGTWQTDRQTDRHRSSMHYVPIR